jgi:hypothetical protein
VLRYKILAYTNILTLGVNGILISRDYREASVDIA